MFRKSLRICCLVVFSLLLACSAKSRLIASSKPNLINPYSLKVVDEIYDGETLFLQVRLKELTKLPDAFSLIALTGYNQDQVKTEKFFNLIDLQKDSENQVTLALPVINLVDYQIQLYWGKQAWDYYRIIYPQLAAALKIINGNVEKLKECQQDACQIKFKIKFDLQNKAEFTIPKINLIISLSEKIATGETVELTELYAKSIPINDFNIASGEVRQLEYLIVQPAELDELPTIAEVRISDKL